MKVWVVKEDNGYRCNIIGVYSDMAKAMEKKMECFIDRDIVECEVE